MSQFLRRSLLIGSFEIAFRLPLLFTAGWLAGGVGPEIFGAWALILLYQSLLAAIVAQGLTASLSRHAAGVTQVQAAGMVRRSFRRMLAGWTVGLGATILLLPALATLLGLPIGSSWLLVLACAIALIVVTEGLLDSFFKARERIGRIIALQAGRTGIEVLVVAGIFIAGIGESRLDGPIEQLAAYVVAVLVLKVVYYAALAIPSTRGGRLDAATWSKMVRHGLPLTLTALIGALYGQGDRLVVGLMMSPAELGIYAFAAMLATNMHMLGTAVFPLVLPRASRAFDAGRPEEVTDLIARSQHLFLIVWLAAMAVVALLPREIILFTAGAEFVGGAPVLALLALAWGLAQYLGLYHWLLQLVRQTGLSPLLTLGQCCLILGAIAAGASLAGGVGAALGAIAGVAVGGGLQFAIVMRLCPLWPPTRVVLWSLATLALMPFMILLGLGDSPPWLRLAIAALVAASCAIAAGRRLGLTGRLHVSGA